METEIANQAAMGTDAYLIGMSMITKIICALTAHVVIRLSLSHFDKTLGFNFKDWLSRVSDEAKATYLGYRILAVSILFGLILGL